MSAAPTFTSASWVLADSFDAVTFYNERPLHLWDVDLAHELDYVSCPVCDGEGCAAYGDSLTLCGRCDGVGEVLDLIPLPEPERLEPVCGVCLDIGWLTVKGQNVWFRKLRVHDPVRYKAFYEHRDVTAIACPEYCVARLAA